MGWGLVEWGRNRGLDRAEGDTRLDGVSDAPQLGVAVGLGDMYARNQVRRHLI